MEKLLDMLIAKDNWNKSTEYAKYLLEISSDIKVVRSDEIDKVVAKQRAT